MSQELNDLYGALIAARRVADSLSTWVHGADAHDSVRNSQRVIELGFSAYERLSRDLRDGRKHVEAPEDFKATGCMCSWPTASPPCSWCTDPANNEEESGGQP